MLGRGLFLVFMIVPLIEIALFVVLGQAIGLWPTLLGVLVTAVTGSLLLRWQGLATLNEVRAATARGEVPARALAEGMMIAVGGVLLLTPGYFTDLIGILLLIPPVRALIYAELRKRIRVTPLGGSRPGPGRPSSIELGPDEWRSGQP
jgi:UPF0716 protein FxsA